MEYQPTIGLEIHAELATASKMFCACRNNPDEKEPNRNVCPICLAHPGTLPTLNREAIRQVLRVGLAVGGTLADLTEWDRKNYFYPDIPKGYQISQYAHPLVTGGELNGVKLTRLHLEEDTATSKHDRSDEHSLVDFNRAGVPLLELVTEPVIKSAKAAGDFARELQLLLRYLGASGANMEKGELRVEANISIAPAVSSSALGTKVEVKNLNSFRAVERAIEYELARQRALLEKGEAVTQETRGWDEVKQETFSQRQKESSHDYRYFPDPDLPKLRLSQIPEFQNLESSLPELPWQKRERLAKLGFLQKQDIEQLVGDLTLADFFDRAEAELKEPELIKIAANIILNDIAGKRKKEADWLPELNYFVETIRRRLPLPQTRNSILSGAVAAVAAAESLPDLVDEVIAAHPAVVADFRAGKQAALQFLVGQGMKASRGAANPEILQKLLTEKLRSA